MSQCGIVSLMCLSPFKVPTGDNRRGANFAIIQNSSSKSCKELI